MLLNIHNTLSSSQEDDDIVQQASSMELRTRNIIVGSLLGDGWFNGLSSTGKTNFRVKYNDKSFGFLKWIREQLLELKPSELKTIPKYSQHYFFTKSSKELGDFRKLFYPNEGMKRVPQNIAQLLTDPISLAIWYQDDGTLDRRSKYHWNARLATYCFPYEDCVLLSKAVRQNLGIETSVCRCQMRKKMYYQLYVPSKSMNLFIETVKPYIHPDYAYKIFRLN